MAGILIIEDDPTLQEAYGFILEAGGHTVSSAYNGKEGLELAKKKRYDIILLDVHMPVMDGWEFLKRFKKFHHPDTKIIVFSNMIEPETHKQAMELGAHQSILKSSMTPKDILELIQKF